MELFIVNSQIEGEHKLKSVHCVRLSYERVIMAIILSICSGFLAAFYFRWFPKQFINFLYVTCTFEKATHIRTNPFEETCNIIRIENRVFFIFRFLKYELVNQQFKPLEYVPQNPKPLKSEEVLQQRREYGFSLIKIPMVGFIKFTLEELSTPFYTLQYICVVVWLVQGFFYFAIIMMSCSFISTFVKFYLLKHSLIRLQSLAAISQIVTVIRNDQQEKIDANELVPGDIIVLQPMAVPADCIITGMALLNEATLTGESNPVPKQTGQMMFEGTKLLEAKGNSTALVIRTNYSTIRGQYFRNVIFPLKTTNKFYTQALKFLLQFAVFNVIIIASTLVIYLDFSTELILASVFSALAWIFPPAMPIFFSLAISIALLRLKGQNVIGSDMEKIHIAGQVSVVCFDKTGTLTTNELIAIELWDRDECNICLSCCHHICQSEGQLVGDVLDLEMFKYSKSKIEFNQEDILVTSRENNKYKVIRIFDFNSELMLMSVIVQFEDKFYFCTKGAPEKIQLRLNKHDEEMAIKLSNYVNQGFRVISLAQKEIKIDEINLERDQLEKNLNFLGYLIFENPLKNDTIEVMGQLINSNLKVKILSGDNPLTTVNQAFNIGLVKNKIKLFDIKQQQIQEIDIEKIDGKQQINLVKTFPLDSQNLQDYIYSLDTRFCLTGDFMEYCNQNKLDTMNLYLKTLVFSRVKPHQKKEVIQVHQQQKYCVAMVGDGSNDCSAIAQADIGVSFSQSDASYTAHFSSLNESIKCIVTILAQGRATAQTLIEIFLLYILYSFLDTTAYTLLALEAQNYTDLQLLYLDFIGEIVIMAFLTLSKPLTTLSKELPLDDMHAMNNQLSFYTRLFIYTGGLLTSGAIILNGSNHYFEKPSPPIDEYIRKGMLNTTVAIVAQINSQFLAFVHIVSKPFKEPFYKNYAYTFYAAIYTILTIVYMFCNDTHQFLDLVDLNSEIDYFNVYLLLILVGVLILDQTIQKILQIKFPRRKFL